MTQEEKNKELIRTYNEQFWNKGNLDVFDTYHAAEFIQHNADGDMDREQWRALCRAYFVGFPDLRITTDDLVVEGDKVTKVWTANCTHAGEFLGIPATGNRVTVKGIEVLRIANGKIAELWMSMDTLGMLRQLGVIPPMEEAKKPEEATPHLA
jgi:steroid delta-isomerase-like uncharacterized protein